MKFIELTQGKKAVVDDQDYAYLSQFSWHYSRYAIRSENGKKILMHRQIMRTPRTMETDHRDGDTLNNQRFNLRTCTKAQNQANRKKSAGTISTYKGVTRDRRKNLWLAQIMNDKKNLFIGYFKEERHAGLAYDIAAKDLFGDYARTNFTSAC